MKAFIYTALMFLGSSLYSIKADAHPHSWIDLETTVLFDDQGHMTGLHVGWLFDEFFTAYTLEDIQKDPKKKPPQSALNKLAEQDIKNLSEYQYFTFVKVEGKRQDNDVVHDYKIEVRGNRLWLEFTVPLKTSIDVKAHSVEYAVYDPTYYIEVLYAEKTQVVRLDGYGKTHCQYVLHPPEPPKEMSLFAAGLDQNQTAGDGIGEMFAERVVLTCE